MGLDAQAFLERWHRIVAERDMESLAEVLADDVTIGAPPYWKKLEGRDLVRHLLGFVIESIEGFTYHREWVRDGELALEFTGRVGELELQGIDLISLDDDNRLQNLDVMVRPINAASALRDRVAPRMAEYLGTRG